jgi:hypothetical protein
MVERYVPVALIQETNVIRFPLSVGVRDCLFLVHHADNFTMSASHFHYSYFINNEYSVGLMIRFVDVKKKILDMFSDVKPFIRAAEMPSVLTDKTGFILKKKVQSHFSPAADFS